MQQRRRGHHRRRGSAVSLEEVFKKITAWAPKAIYVVGDPYLWVARKQVADLALGARLPTTRLLRDAA
jgi:hypothetical protein